MAILTTSHLRIICFFLDGELMENGYFLVTLILPFIGECENRMFISSEVTQNVLTISNFKENIRTEKLLAIS